MNWSAVGAVGEILGAFAVVATLGYLAVQIRQNTRTERASSRQTILDTFYSSVWDTARDVELRKITILGLKQYGEMEPDEAAAFHFVQLRYVGNLYNALLLRDSGSLDEESFQVIANAFVGGLLTPGGGEWWAVASEGNGVPPSVKRYIEQRLQADAEVPLWQDVLPVLK